MALDVTTLLSKFLQDLQVGTLGTAQTFTTLTLTGTGGVTLSNPSTNVLTVPNITLTGGVNAGAANFIGFTGRSYLNSPLDGQMVLGNAASTAGVGMDVTTDGTFSVLSRAMADTAIVKASRFQVSATAGVVTFGPAAVASITVKGGIITAIS